MRQTGAIVSGRRLFDVAGAWGGKHPMGVVVVVVTHSIPREWNYEGSPFTFVTDGVEAAIEKARQIAQDKDIGVGGADMAGVAAVAAGLVPASEGGRSGMAPTRGAATSESGRTRGMICWDRGGRGVRMGLGWMP